MGNAAATDELIMGRGMQVIFIGNTASKYNMLYRSEGRGPNGIFDPWMRWDGVPGPGQKFFRRRRRRRRPPKKGLFGEQHFPFDSDT